MLKFLTSWMIALIITISSLFSQNELDWEISSVAFPGTSYLTEAPAPPTDSVFVFPNFKLRKQPAYQSDNFIETYDPVVQTATKQSGKDIILRVNTTGIASTGASPPDPTGDVGLNHYIQGLNGFSGCIYKIFDKDGVALTGNLSMSNLGSGFSGLGDGIILYDEQEDRWFLTEFSSSTDDLYIFVSKTSDPTGAYHSYKFLANSFPDYPKYGLFGKYLSITTNESGNPPVYVIEKDSLIKGAPAFFIRKTTSALSAFGFQALSPVDFEGETAIPPGEALYFMRHRDDEIHNSGSNNASEDYIDIYVFTPNFASPASSTFLKTQSLPVAEFSSELCGTFSFSCIPQPGTTTKLDPLREVIMNKISYRNFGSHQSIVLCFAVDVDNTEHAGIRWVELRKNGGTTWSLHQQGTYAPDANHRWMPSIGMDKSGNIALAYSKSSSSVFPSLFATGRSANDPLGQMTFNELELVAGTSRSNGNRWGDYFQMGVDPTNNSEFWFTGEYGASNSWKSHISAFSLQTDSLDIALDSINIQGDFSCSGVDTLFFRVKNLDSLTLSTFSLEHKVNGGSAVITNFNSNMDSGATQNFKVVVSGLNQGNNSIFAQLQSPNGSIAKNIVDDSLSISFPYKKPSKTLYQNLTHIDCFGDSTGQVAIAVVGSHAPFMFKIDSGIYQSNNTFTGLKAGTYQVLVIDTLACEKSIAISINESPEITINNIVFPSDTPETKGKIQVIASGGAPPYEYQLNAGIFQEADSFINLDLGDYKITVRDSKSCEAADSATVSDIKTSIFTGKLLENNFTLFPNPNQGVFYLSWKDLAQKRDYKLLIFNIQGALMESIDLELQKEGQAKIESKKLSKGTFQVLIVQENIVVWNSTLLVQ